jgi:hypothetical protein
MKKLLIVKNSKGAEAGWNSTAKNSGIVFSYNEDTKTVSSYKKFGCDPTKAEFFTMLCNFLNSVPGDQKAEISKRVHPFRFTSKFGMSGCEYVYIEYADNAEFPTRKHLFDISCFGKIAYLNNVYVMDLVDYMLQNQDLCIEDLYIKIVDSRNIQEEEGWIFPQQEDSEN